MKDPGTTIRQWLYDNLQGITYGGAAVPVYSFPPKDVAMPYIVIGDMLSTGEESTKDCYLSAYDYTIEIWTSFTGNSATYVPADNVANQITQKLRGQTPLLTKWTNGINGYDTFVSAGANIVSAITDGFSGCIAYSNALGDIASAGKVYVKFNLSLGSGIAPSVYLSKGTTTAISDDVLCTNGANSIILTATESVSGFRLSFVNFITEANSFSTDSVLVGFYPIPSFGNFNCIRTEVRGMMSDRFMFDNKIVIYKSLSINFLMEEL